MSLIDETRSVVVILAQFLLTFICWISTWSETTEEKLKQIERKRIGNDTISGTLKLFPLSLTSSARTNLSEMRFTKTKTLPSPSSILQQKTLQKCITFRNPFRLSPVLPSNLKPKLTQKVHPKSEIFFLGYESLFLGFLRGL